MPPTVRRDGPSDKTIVRRARQGDRAAFLSLLRRYDPRLRRLALQLLADPRRLDRVLSRAYLKAWRSVPFLKRSESPAKWLYRIVYNTCLNEVRWEPTRQPPPPPDGDRVPLPVASAERRLLALRALRYDERVPLVLVDGEGFDVEDAAHMVSRSVDEVADDLARARGRWRAFVMGEPEPPPPPERPAEPAPTDGTNGHELWPLSQPNPLVGRDALATLATPTPQREPGGHVKLLADEDIALVAQPPSPARLAGLRSAEDLAPLVETPDVAPRPDGPDDDPSAGQSSPAAKTSKGRRRNGSRRIPPGKAAGSGRSAATGRGNGQGPTGTGNVSTRRVRSAGPAGTGETGRGSSTGSAEAGTGGTGSTANGAGTGAGARRKRRRDAKRAGRTSEAGGGSTSPAETSAPPKTGTDGESA